MAKFDFQPKATFEIKITMNEEEARALEAITSYGDDAFIDKFYGYLGKAYLEPYEKGLRSLFGSVRERMQVELDKIDKIKKIMYE